MLPGKPGKDKKTNYKPIKKQNKMSRITLSPKKFDDYITSTDDNLQIITRRRECNVIKLRFSTLKRSHVYSNKIKKQVYDPFGVACH